MIRTAMQTLRMSAAAVAASTLGLAAMCTIGISGCVDQEAAEARRSREVLADVLKTVAEAEQGYVPNEEKYFKTVEYDTPGRDPVRAENQRVLSEFRRQKLEAAAEQLETIKNKGRVGEQIAAKRLLAEIYGSFAREKTQRAQTSAADLVNQGSALIGYLVEAQRLTHSANVIITDESDLLSALRNYISELRGELTRLQREQSEWKRKIEDYEARIAEQQKTVQEATRKSTRLRQEAFKTDGEEGHELTMEAIALEKKAAMAAAEADRLRVQLDVFKGEKSIIDKKVAAIEDAIASAQAQIDEAISRQGSAKEAVEAARQAIQEGPITRLRESFDQVLDRFEQRVEQKFSASGDGDDRGAIPYAEMAVENAEAALENASGREKAAAEFDLLVRRTDLAYVLTAHALALEKFADDLQLLAERVSKLLPENEAEHYVTNADRIAKRADEARNEAAAAIDKAMEVAGGISGSAIESEHRQDFNTAVTTIQGRLESLREQLSATTQQ